MSDRVASLVELNAMLIGRDVLMEKILEAVGNEAMAELWHNAVGALDKSILEDGLLEAE